MRARSTGWRAAAGVCAFGLAGVYLALALGGDLRERPEAFLILAGLASILFCAGSVALSRPGVRGRLGIVLGGALLFRAILLPTVPSLSDDVWRYLWDGRVAAAGIDPFRYAPDDPELAELRDEVWERVNHRHIATIYPPAAQLLFRLADAAGGLWPWKLLVLLFDAAAGLAILRILRRSGRDPALLVLYAWNPLVLIEFAGNAHVDAAAVATVAWTVAALRERRERWALGWVTLGAAIKIFPLALLPLVIARVRDRRSWWIPVVVGSLLALPYAEAGVRMLSSGGLRAYAIHWEFNAPLFEGIRALTDSPSGTRRVLALALIGFAVTLAFRSREDPDPTPAALSCLGALLLASPTLHPWYVTWIVVLVPLVTRGPRVAWLLLSQTVLLSYAVLIPLDAVGQWHLPRWALALEWAPFYGVLLWEIGRGRRASALAGQEPVARS